MGLVSWYSQPYNNFTIEISIIFYSKIIIHQKNHIALSRKRYIYFKYNSLQAVFYALIKSSKSELKFPLANLILDYFSNHHLEICYMV